MENEIKTILLEIVKDLADLRANQGLLGHRVGTGVKKYDADEAKNVALKESLASYGKLIAKIRAL